jgi:pimeloyl-ACP methyl ester carboxylesterase
MSSTKHVRCYAAKTPSAQEVLLLCGFGGSIWQTKRLVNVLRRDGYNVTALDFPKEVLSAGDMQALPNLVREVVAFAEAKAKSAGKPMLLVGISLGALISLNIIRRSPLFSHGVLVTGGDIAKIAQRMYGHTVWPQSYEELAREWQSINMYTPPTELAGKRLLFVLPAKDRLIDPTDVHREVKIQNDAGNHLLLVTRHAFGHIGTIVEETILFPHRILGYIARLRE